MLKFFENANLPDYLEEALSPLVWSSIFSEEFKNEVSNLIMCTNPDEALPKFKRSLEKLSFLDKTFKEQLIRALERYNYEKRNTQKPA